MTWLSKYSPYIYAVLRIATGFMYGFHGLQKIFGVLTDHHPAIGTELWFGGIIELVCGTLMIIGLFTSWAAFLASGEMAVAYFQVHWKFQFNENALPIVNKGELAVVYCCLFLYIASRGGVKWCIDKIADQNNSL